MVGLAILALALLPLGYSFVRERQVLKSEYLRGVADELVDGETEVLAAGAAKNLPEGKQAYAISGKAAEQLPPGHFELTKTGNRLRLAWLPDANSGLGAVVREAVIQ